jgi:predicted O-linked N-acetylglucosamine transferase (SPINDLY family)
LSGDFWGHALSYFVNQLFAHHDRDRIELFAYPTQISRYHLSESIRSHAEHWSPVHQLSDVALCDRICRDEIDVLVDLSGHTGHNRLGAFARRAAPVQAHYLGFMASTGLSQMDYWIGDEVLTPPETDSHFSERVWRLPRVWLAYSPGKDAPELQWRPAEDGAVWIGSFNNIGKLTPATLALWARVLHALPEGRMLLKTKYLADAGSRQRILDALDSHGIPASRIELQDQTATPSWNLHMAYYHRLDVALDPVGAVGGGTTTCDALWMGVPVVTLAGDRMATRMSSSMLDAIGHPEWIARSEQEYIEKVVALARNPQQRRQIRLSLRTEMARSPLCDAKGLATALEDAYFAMFDRWQRRDL